MAKRGRRTTLPPERCACPTGWVRNRSLIQPGPLDAAIMQNVIPTATGCRARGGSSTHATLGDDGTFLASYTAGGAANVLFATTATSIYDVTSPADADTEEAALLTGFSSGEWSSQGFATAGGKFQWFVNGTDNAALFDGTNLYPITDEQTRQIDYDTLTADFEIGETLTGGTSGATAEVVGITRSTSTTGSLFIGNVTGGPFVGAETITSASGSATVNSVVGVALANTISGIEGSALSFVWTHGKRLWFVEGGELSAWYLGAGAISGTLTEFPMQGVFNQSSALLFGGRMSGDSGAGMDDRMVFVTVEGEVAIYAGTNPASAATWALEGVYKISPPLGKRAFCYAAGDMLIATEAGLVSIKSVMGAGEMAPHLSFDVEDFWQDTVAERTAAYSFSVTMWHSRTYLVIGLPAQMDGQPLALVMSTSTNRWALILGWDVQHSVVHDDRLYYTNAAGTVRQADTTGADAGEAYYSIVAPMFRSGNASQKYAKMSRVIYKGAGNPKVCLLTDFDGNGIEYPISAAQLVQGGWGSGVWGTSLWGGAEDSVTLRWQSTPANGYSFTPAVVAGWSANEAPSFEIVVVETLYEMGREM